MEPIISLRALAFLYSGFTIANVTNIPLSLPQSQLEISLVSTVEEALAETFDGGLTPTSKL